MSTQKITLASDGTVIPTRMQPYSTGQAIHPPAVRISRLQELIRSQEPKICLVRGEGIGDVLTTTPLVHAIKEQFKKVNITYATNTKYLDGALVKVLKYNPDIDHITERQLLRDQDYDLVINLHCPCVSHEKPGCVPISRIDLFARHVGIALKDPVPRYYIQKEEIEAGEALMGPLMRENTILVQPSASARRRSMDHKTLKKACTTLFTEYGIRSIFLTHSTDGVTDILWNNISGAAVFPNLSIREVAGVMYHCNLVLCPDSSILHLAAALYIPTVGLFGPSHPTARIGHYKNAVSIWEGDKMVPCPCWYSACPINEACWSAISSESIVDTCIKQLKKPTNPLERNLSYIDTGLVVETEII